MPHPITEGLARERWAFIHFRANLLHFVRQLQHDHNICHSGGQQ
jgi:hypothetical protein